MSSHSPLPTSNTDRPSLFSWRTTSYAQILLISAICFGAPGMFNALSSIGAGLPAWDQATTSTGQGTLQWTFAFFSILAPTILTRVGIRPAVFIGASGYLLYTIALYNYSLHDKSVQNSLTTRGDSSSSRSIFLAASAWLGICAAMIWTTQGAVIMAFPTKESSGRMVAIFWFIFNSGALFGSVWSFVENYSANQPGANSGTYFGFMGIMGVASLLAVFMCEANSVRREDGSYCELKPVLGVKAELKGILATFMDTKMLLLTPMMLYSNWCYTYQFNIFNVSIFDVRTRSYMSIYYWGAQMLGAILLGKVLDNPKWSIRKRATISFTFTVVLGVLAWGLSVWVQAALVPGASTGGYDFTEAQSLLPAAVYTCFGFLDALVQVWLYWIMSNLTEDSNTLVRYSGYYKTIQNIGAGIAAELNSTHTVSPMAQLLINCVIFLVCLVPSYIAIGSLEEVEVAPAADKSANLDSKAGKSAPVVEGKEMVVAATIVRA